jgi:c-di-GMP-binding flagellar brake protein YcgR
MMYSEERREATRVPTPSGEAFCHIKGFGCRYRMRDLSLSGVLLIDGPGIPIGTHIEVVLFACGLGMVSLPARVARIEDETGSLALRFELPIAQDARKRLKDLVFCAQINEI